MGDPVLAGLVIVLLLAIGLVMWLGRPKPGGDLATPLQILTQAVQELHKETAVLAQKVTALEPIPSAVNSMQSDLKVLAERVQAVEGSQAQTNRSLADVRNGLTETGTTAAGLIVATAAIQHELESARTNLTELKTQAHTRIDLENRTAQSIQRLEAIIAGTQSKGAAGENIVEAILSELPMEWQVHGFAVGGKICEFGLRLPNNLVLPIDSKWAATHLLEQFATCEDPAERQKLRSQIEATVLTKAREVRKYIDPALTPAFGIAAVPDSVYSLCGTALCQVLEMNVVVIAYSMLVPYLLLVFQTILKTSQNIDLEKLDRVLRDAEECVQSLQDELEGRHARALTMLSNSRAAMSEQAGKLSSRITSLKLGHQSTLAAEASEPSEQAAIASSL